MRQENITDFQIAHNYFRFLHNSNVMKRTKNELEPIEQIIRSDLVQIRMQTVFGSSLLRFIYDDFLLYLFPWDFFPQHLLGFRNRRINIIMIQ